MANSDITAFSCGGELVVDSRLIAERLGIEHRSFVRTTKKYQPRIEKRFGHLRCEITTVKNSVGAENEAIHYLLTEPQATSLMSFSKNTEEVIECKLDLVEAFEKAKTALKSLTQPTENLAIEAWVLDHPQPWEEHFFPAWRKEAERLTGWKWSWRCMSQFINQAVYDWMPTAVTDRLNEVNPTDISGRRQSKQHQHLTDGADTQVLKDYIRTSYELMIVCGYKSEFLRLIRNRHTKAIQPWLF
ncbi:hypothetical protein D0962_17940 [Leptolyngbyaceae cyanobacterium CCMR0082]|uniref:Bacteriophage Mx8 p63 C-terminal domain-containing protein n=1 Tax=Adonisia turfae CCMR0082 TaxID=2304604 RepID=A0A6M0S840_9CYAN|nr:Rha family transcriptional regulator [Adonisia turfae]NEZ64647.1 hypothetical protein [Adonisia turfae CCMR0082]